MNIYRYVGNNPINISDPTGLNSLCDAKKALDDAEEQLKEKLKDLELAEKDLDRAIESGDMDWIQRADTAVEFAKSDVVIAGSAVTDAQVAYGAASLEALAAVSAIGLADITPLGIAAVGTLGIAALLPPPSEDNDWWVYGD